MQVSKEIEYIGFCLLKAVIFIYFIHSSSSLQTTAQSDNASSESVNVDAKDWRKEKKNLIQAILEI